MWFAKFCPICKKKVEKSELKKIETVGGQKSHVAQTVPNILS